MKYKIDDTILFNYNKPIIGKIIGIHQNFDVYLIGLDNNNVKGWPAKILCKDDYMELSKNIINYPYMWNISEEEIIQKENIKENIINFDVL
mgnify:CR=1 FL=1